MNTTEECKIQKNALENMCTRLWSTSNYLIRLKFEASTAVKVFMLIWVYTLCNIEGIEISDETTASMFRVNVAYSYTLVKLPILNWV
jgi:hypothetical protein